MKKILLGLGTVTMLALPLANVISCGSNKNQVIKINSGDFFNEYISHQGINGVAEFKLKNFNNPDYTAQIVNPLGAYKNGDNLQVHFQSLGNKTIKIDDQKAQKDFTYPFKINNLFSLQLTGDCSAKNLRGFSFNGVDVSTVTKWPSNLSYTNWSGWLA